MDLWSSDKEETSNPFIKYFPEEGLSKHPRIFIRVVFPEPDWPIIDKNWPEEIDKSMELNALTVSASVL